jgi:hypothetical protein
MKMFASNQTLMVLTLSLMMKKKDQPTTSSATNPEITVNGMREENIANFMTKYLPVQPVNVIEDEDEPLAAKNPQAKLL